jgi:cupin superfamily acireductone dioxygenase involved in methionine salvage
VLTIDIVSTYSQVLTIDIVSTYSQDLNDLFNTIYRDHNGEDVEVIYCLDEEALAEFDEFDEQICSRLN